MGAFQAIYTDAQREAVEHAVLDRGIAPANRVAQLAQAGELADLEPFTIPPATIRDMARRARKRRAGELRSGLSDVPAAQAIDVLRKRLVSAADLELERLERKQRRGMRLEPREVETMRQVARILRELAALPDVQRRATAPGARHAPAPGETEGQKDGGATTGGIGGAIMRDVRKQRTTPYRDTESDSAGSSPGERGMDGAQVEPVGA
jgi:hypothetical protein